MPAAARWHAGCVSNLEDKPQAIELAPGVVGAVEVVEARKAAIGDGTEVRRLLPQRQLRTIGAWCFLDHYGPDDVSAGPGMQVPPHPHIGLQTVSWLFEGLVLHRDGTTITVIVGEHAGQRSPATVYTPLVGLQIETRAGQEVTVPLRTDFEHGVLATDGPATVGRPEAAAGPATADTAIAPGQLAHLPAGLNSVRLSTPGAQRFLIVGGAPFGEHLVMWWNFVARTSVEMEEARAGWMAGRFGDVTGYEGDPLPAPPLPPTPLKAR
jgi:redox-sensitive bicupin YhaK (pirin superfamily)